MVRVLRHTRQASLKWLPMALVYNRNALDDRCSANRTDKEGTQSTQRSTEKAAFSSVLCVLFRLLKNPAYAVNRD